MLCIEGETPAPGSLAALPRLVALARSETRALEMAGAIVRSAMTDDQGEADEYAAANLPTVLSVRLARSEIG
ncbi:hypothetical protein ACIBVL_21565 [Streptomyces sp. NPDC049687]|uniref:hypothetical protein n=1 Tax=Streptomyces sp. NPDC049687 TaxID=3365596 RepID=UPI0037968FFC